MLCKLKLLYRDGVQFIHEELAALPSYAGNLVVEDWPHSNSFGRFIRLAWGTQRVHGAIKEAGKKKELQV